MVPTGMVLGGHEDFEKPAPPGRARHDLRRRRRGQPSRVLPRQRPLQGEAARRASRPGRGGYVKVALRTRSPIVPVAIVGAEEVHYCLGDVPQLAEYLHLPFFPLMASLAPLPAHIYIRFGRGDLVRRPARRGRRPGARRPAERARPLGAPSAHRRHAAPPQGHLLEFVRHERRTAKGLRPAGHRRARDARGAGRGRLARGAPRRRNGGAPGPHQWAPYRAADAAPAAYTHRPRRRSRRTTARRRITLSRASSRAMLTRSARPPYRTSPPTSARRCPARMSW